MKENKIMFVQWIVMRKMVSKISSLLRSPSTIYMSRALTLHKNLSYLSNFSSMFCSTYSTQLFHIASFPYQKSQWKVQVNVVTPQELGVCGESNEINGKKNWFVFDC